jgi:hypothetical protein
VNDPTPPTPPVESIWSRGSRTVTQVGAETGLSRQEIWERMDDGTFRWFAHGNRGKGGRGTRFIAWGDVVDYLDRLHRDHKASACAHTQEA